MMNENTIIYLKKNVHVVPLISKWYVWSQLLYPLTAACNITKRHLPIMQSFLNYPEAHIDACNNPELAGGPFMNIPLSEISYIESLLEDTKIECAELLELAKDIISLFELTDLQDGDSLEKLYSEIPQSLKGCVEIAYNLLNKANPRFLESQIYKKFSIDHLHETILFEHNSDARPFVLSNPVNFKELDYFSIKKPFATQDFNILYASRTKGISVKKLFDSDLFNSNPSNNRDILKLFTTNKPEFKQDTQWPDEILRVRYFGHACVLLQSSDQSLLVDPFISYDYNTNLDRFTYSDLPEKIDYVCITHSHQDHFQIETILNLRHKIGTVIVPRCATGTLEDPSLKNTLLNLGFKNILELDEFEQLNADPFKITAVPFFGEHGDLNVVAKSGYVISVNGKSIFFAVDSNNIDNRLYENLYNMVGKIDGLYIGMECQGAPMSWLYGPIVMKKLNRSWDQSRRLSGSNFVKAKEIVNTLQPNYVYVYAMGLEPWLSHIMGMHIDHNSLPILESNLMINWCKEMNIPCERLFGKKETVV